MGLTLFVLSVTLCVLDYVFVSLMARKCSTRNTAIQGAPSFSLAVRLHKPCVGLRQLGVSSAQANADRRSSNVEFCVVERE